jgi:type I restriction enzyme, S subunit
MAEEVDKKSFSEADICEQQSIVAKVDLLMALCDLLEASRTASASTLRSFLVALFAEALVPAGKRPEATE